MLQTKLTAATKGNKKKIKRYVADIDDERERANKAESMLQVVESNFENQKRDFEKTIHSLEDEKGRLNKTIYDLNFKLQSTAITKQLAGPDVQVSLTKAEILEERIKSQNILFSEKENQRTTHLKFLESEIANEREKFNSCETERANLDVRLKVALQEVENLRRDLREKREDEESEVNTEINSLQMQLSSAKELLAKSESDRLELREKYLHVGSKVESLLISEALESDEIIKSLENKLMHQKRKYKLEIQK